MSMSLDDAWEDLRCELELSCGIDLPPDRPVTAWGPDEKVKTIRLALEDKRLSDRLLVEKSNRIRELENKLRELQAKIAKDLEDLATQESQRKVEYDKGYEEGSSGKDYRPTSRSYIEGYESGQFSREYRSRNGA